MQLSNEALYHLCKKYGSQAKLWRQKFIGLLPEVNRRKLYENKGFGSIFEFAAKLCGLSADQVRLALNLEKRFEDKPVLKKMLETGEASINKLARVVSIASQENEQELAEKIKLLPQKALETLVRDEKILASGQNQNGLQIGFFDDKSLRAQTLETSLNFKLDEDVTKELNELNSMGIDVNAVLREMLQKRTAEIEQQKAEISIAVQPTKSRYIPAKIKKILKQEFGKKCSIQTCQKPSEAIHHSQRFSLTHNHDPHYLAPLCAEHHVIAHTVDMKFHQVHSSKLDSV